MTPDEIIKMAREAGAYAPKYPIGPHDVQFSVASLERFFRMAQEAEADRIANESKHIIKRAEARGAEAEREACAKVVEDYCGAWDDGGYALAATIRARGQA